MFTNNPYLIAAKHQFDDVIRIPNLLDLASMKALALGGRAKWKDYVDLYFIMRGHFHQKDIAENAKKIFSGAFNPKLFKAQLSYFEDIDYTEAIEWMPNKEVVDKEIKNFLIDKATESF